MKKYISTILMMVITADNNNSVIGINTYISKGTLKNLRFEFGYPLYQDLNGIQLKTKETLTLGTQYSF